MHAVTCAAALTMASLLRILPVISRVCHPRTIGRGYKEDGSAGGLVSRLRRGRRRLLLFLLLSLRLVRLWLLNLCMPEVLVLVVAI